MLPTMPVDLPPLFDRLPPQLAPHFDPLAPWNLLGDALDDILDSLPAGVHGDPGPHAHLASEALHIGAGTSVAPGVVIEGRGFLGAGVQIRPGAYLRGGFWIGDGAVVGANTEVKRAIFLPGAKAPHLSYVGDSVLGARVNLGAGTILSNFRHDADEVRILVGSARLATGRRKLGAILGDGVLTGCNCVLNPGVIVGRESQIYPGIQLRSGVYPERVIVKLRQRVQIIEQRQPAASRG